MPYRINVYNEKDGILTEDKESRHLLYVDQAEKAIITFEMDMFVCYLYRLFTDEAFKDKAEDLRERLRNGDDLSDDERDKIDLIYEDILALAEFYQNRITSQGDPAIERMMTHLRYSAAYLLRVDQSRAGKHEHPRSNKKLNTALFRHDQKDDLRDISHLDYNGLDLKKMVSGTELDSARMTEVLEKVHGKAVPEYYSRILSSMDGKGSFYVRLKDEDNVGIWNSLVPGGLYRFKSKSYAPLFTLIRSIEEKVPESIMATIDLDYKDLCNGTIRMMAPAMGRIRNRDENLESSLSTPESVSEGHDEAVIKDAMFFIRMLDCIFGNSINERGKVELALSFEGMIRLLDSKLFGWNYDVPQSVFCTESRMPFEIFRDGIDRISENGVIMMESIKIGQSVWTVGKRMKEGNRPLGGVCSVPEPEYLSKEDLPGFLDNVKEPVIIVTDLAGMDDLVSYLSSFTKVSDKAKVKFVAVADENIRMMFINSLIPYTTLTVVNRKNIFDMLTLYNLKLMRSMAESYQKAFASELGVDTNALCDIEAKDFRTVFYKTYASYAKALIDDVERVESYFL
ncbi:MAG: hypothetical protein IJT54_04710 [Candidatus Methanomethylophilaceae archaeon]|nr:hypothetical protein [Candidatus Methanomethylophilaceae archaeon]